MRKYIKRFNEGEHLIRLVELDLLIRAKNVLVLALAAFYAFAIGYIVSTLEFDPLITYAIIASAAIFSFGIFVFF